MKTYVFRSEGTAPLWSKPFSYDCFTNVTILSLVGSKADGITCDCQNADPPTAASRYMAMMKICTSVTSMLTGQTAGREGVRNV